MDNLFFHSGPILNAPSAWSEPIQPSEGSMLHWIMQYTIFLWTRLIFEKLVIFGEKLFRLFLLLFFWISDDTSRIGIIWFELWRWKPCPFDKEIDVGTTNRFRNEDLHITRAIWNICYIICCIFIVSGWRQVTSFTPRAKKTWNCIFFSAISGIIDDIQKHFDIGPSQTSLLRTRIVEFRLV